MKTIKLDDQKLNKVAGADARKRENFVSRLLSISHGHKLCALQSDVRGGMVFFVCA